MKVNLRNPIIVIIAGFILLALLLGIMFRYKINFIGGYAAVARYNRWTGKVTVILPVMTEDKYIRRTKGEWDRRKTKEEWDRIYGR